jgi:hypothetical protein
MKGVAVQSSVRAFRLRPLNVNRDTFIDRG